MNLSAIFSKTGKGVQEASGKTSNLSRADRAVLAAIDGKTMLSEVQKHFEKLAGPKFEALIQQLDKDGFIREVSSGQSAAPTRPAAPAAKAPPKAAPPPPDDGDDMDFTQAIKIPPRAPSTPKPPPVDLAASARAEAERKKTEEQALDFRAREQVEAKAKIEADLKSRAAAEARAKADAEAKARAEAEAKARDAAQAKARADAEAKAKEAEAKARADADAKTHAEADAKVKAAREAAVRMATEAKAKAEADAKAKAEAAERDKARLEAELNAKLAAERKAREEAEQRAAEAAERARKEMEEKAKRDAEEMRQRLEAEMKAKLEAERKAREEEDRKRREEEDRRRKEEDERRAKEDAERRAREEADRKKREEEDRKRREEDERRRKEEDERRAKEDAERKAREEADRKKREEADRKRKEDDERRALEETNRKMELERRAKEDAERRAKEDADRRAKEDAERKAKEDADRRAKEDAERRSKEEAEAKARAAADALASLPKVDAVAPPPPPPPAAAPAGGGFGDSLLADLDSFGKREEEEQKAKEEADRKAKEEAARKAKEEAERKAKDDAERRAKEEAERRRKEEEERRAQEEEDRRAREEEERLREEEAERKRKAKEALAAKQAEELAAKGAGGKAAAGDDIDVSEEDLDKDDLKRDQKVAADRARKTAREAPPVAVASGRPRKWGRPAAIALFVLLLAGVAVLNLMPLSTAEYEKAASDAMGVPVKISSARLQALAGVEVKLEGVTIGNAKISKVSGTPEIGSLFGARKAFSKLELEGLSVSQAQLGEALLGKVAGENLRIGRVVVKQLVLEGPLKLPALDVEATVAGDGTLQTVKLTGADKLVATLSPKGGDIGFEISAGSFTLPFVPALSLSEFAMKGTANRAGVVSSEFDGRAYDGVVSGTSRIRWGDTWTVEGELRARALKVAVFAPTLVSDGRVEGRATYSMSGSTPALLHENARMQGEFKIDKGVLGSFDLQRALQTSGNQSAGRTIFNELTGQGMYDKGAVQFTNVAISAGAMNAGASLTIDTSKNLSGRIVADVKTASQRQSATLSISGKLQDPVIRK